MRPGLAPRRSGRSAIALLAILALWLQVIVPAIGTTAHWVLAAGHHGHHATLDHSPHGAPKPAAPERDHGGHWGLCCIIGGGKLGTGFAPPPAVQVLPQQRDELATDVRRPERTVPFSAKRSILPVGARAPPRFA